MGQVLLAVSLYYPSIMKLKMAKKKKKEKNLEQLLKAITANIPDSEEKSIVELYLRNRSALSKKAKDQATDIGRTQKVIGGSIIGGLIGYMGGLLGIGGGVFIVPLLIYILKLPTKTAAATSMFIVIFSSFSGFIAHVQIVKPDWTFLILAAAFSFAGGQLGARVMAEKLRGRTVRQIFGVVLLIFAAKLIQKAFF